MKKLIRVLLTPPNEDVVFVEDVNVIHGVVVIFHEGMPTVRHVIKRDDGMHIVDFEGVILFSYKDLQQLVGSLNNCSAYQLNGAEKPKRIVLEKPDIENTISFKKLTEKSVCVWENTHDSKYRIVEDLATVKHLLGLNTEVYLFTNQ